MKKIYRLKREKDINKILQAKKSYGNKAYIIYIKKNIETKHFRIGVTASKKLGNAVVRNKLKRQMRSILRVYKNNIGNYHLFLIARKGCMEISHEEKTIQIESLLKKCGAWISEEK